MNAIKILVRGDRQSGLRETMTLVRTVRIGALFLVALVTASCTASHTSTSTSTSVPPTTSVFTAVPAGWVPVAYGDAQISVPSDWIVMLSGGQYCAANPPGFVYLGPLSSDEGCEGGVKGLPPATAELAFLNVAPASRLPSIELHGIRLFVVDTGPRTLTYDVPSLHVMVSATGSLRHQLMDTLRTSPRAAVLTAAPAAVVPSSWHWLTFASIRYAVPALWPVVRSNTYVFPCGPTSVTLEPGPKTTLDTDQHVLSPGCPFIGSQPPTDPVDGVDINSGFSSVLGGSAQSCVTLKAVSDHGLTACQDTGLPYSVLAVEVTVPGRAKPVSMYIGLAGNGLIARTILYSLRAA